MGCGIHKRYWCLTKETENYCIVAHSLQYVVISVRTVLEPLYAYVCVPARVFIMYKQYLYNYSISK